MAKKRSIAWTDQAHTHICMISLCWGVLEELSNYSAYDDEDDQLPKHCNRGSIDGRAHSLVEHVFKEFKPEGDHKDRTQIQSWKRLYKVVKDAKAESAPHIKSIVKSQLKDSLKELATVLEPHYADLITRGNLRPAEWQRLHATISDVIRSHEARTAALETLGLALDLVKHCRSDSKVKRCKSNTTKLNHLSPSNASPEPRPSGDYTSVVYNDVEYKFKVGQQVEVIKVLFEESRKGHYSISEKEIGRRIKSNCDRFRLSHVFRDKKQVEPNALGNLILKKKRGCYGLPELKSSKLLTSQPTDSPADTESKF